MTRNRALAKLANCVYHSAIHLATLEVSTEMSTTEVAPTPFRFYDNRQKYLAFVSTTNEKTVIATRASPVQ